jgi:hypothetical protein
LGRTHDDHRGFVGTRFLNDHFMGPAFANHEGDDRIRLNKRIDQGLQLVPSILNQFGDEVGARYAALFTGDVEFDDLKQLNDRVELFGENLSMPHHVVTQIEQVYRNQKAGDVAIGRRE